METIHLEAVEKRVSPFNEQLPALAVRDILVRHKFSWAYMWCIVHLLSGNAWQNTESKRAQFCFSLLQCWCTGMDSIASFWIINKVVWIWNEAGHLWGLDYYAIGKEKMTRSLLSSKRQKFPNFLFKPRGNWFHRCKAVALMVLCKVYLNAFWDVFHLHEMTSKVQPTSDVLILLTKLFNHLVEKWNVLYNRWQEQQ